MKNNKAQHEIIGFVLIVLIVSVIGVIFLALTLGNPEPDRQTSLEVSNLLEASMLHTTSCTVSYIPNYQDIQNLVRDCYNDQTGDSRSCLDGSDVCTALENEFKQILDDSLVVSEDSPNRGYKVEIYFSPDSEDVSNDLILSFEEGIFRNCTSIVGGGHPTPAGGFKAGIIETELLVCKN
jgi:hypothetical protein